MEDRGRTGDQSVVNSVNEGSFGIDGNAAGGGEVAGGIGRANGRWREDNRLAGIGIPITVVAIKRTKGGINVGASSRVESCSAINGTKLDIGGEERDARGPVCGMVVTARLRTPAAIGLSTINRNIGCTTNRAHTGTSSEVAGGDIGAGQSDFGRDRKSVV